MDFNETNITLRDTAMLTIHGQSFIGDLDTIHEVMKGLKQLRSVDSSYFYVRRGVDNFYYNRDPQIKVDLVRQIDVYHNQDLALEAKDAAEAEAEAERREAEAAEAEELTDA